MSEPKDVKNKEDKINSIDKRDNSTLINDVNVLKELEEQGSFSNIKTFNSHLLNGETFGSILLKFQELLNLNKLENVFNPSAQGKLDGLKEVPSAIAVEENDTFQAIVISECEKLYDDLNTIREKQISDVELAIYDNKIEKKIDELKLFIENYKSESKTRFSKYKSKLEEIYTERQFATVRFFSFCDKFNIEKSLYVREKESMIISSFILAFLVVFEFLLNVHYLTDLVPGGYLESIRFVLLVTVINMVIPALGGALTAALHIKLMKIPSKNTNKHSEKSSEDINKSFLFHRFFLNFLILLTYIIRISIVILTLCIVVAFNFIISCIRALLDNKSSAEKVNFDELDQSSNLVDIMLSESYNELLNYNFEILFASHGALFLFLIGFLLSLFTFYHFYSFFRTKCRGYNSKLKKVLLLEKKYNEKFNEYCDDIHKYNDKFTNELSRLFSQIHFFIHNYYQLHMLLRNLYLTRNIDYAHACKCINIICMQYRESNKKSREPLLPPAYFDQPITRMFFPKEFKEVFFDEEKVNNDVETFKNKLLSIEKNLPNVHNLKGELLNTIEQLSIAHDEGLHSIYLSEIQSQFSNKSVSVTVSETVTTGSSEGSILNNSNMSTSFGSSTSSTNN